MSLKNNSDFFKKDIWFSELIGKTSYALTADLKDSDLYDPGSEQSREFNNILSGECFIYSKLPATDIKACSFLEDKGFHIIDTNVTFEKICSKKPDKTPAKKNTVRKARDKDCEPVCGIAETNFVFSRFHLDPEISNELADRIKKEWVTNYFRGLRGDLMLVSETEGIITGFCQILEKDDSVVIDLIAVAEGFRKRGVATDILDSIPVFFPDINRIVVGTQVSNIPSVRTYEKSGFRLIDSKYIFHYHGPCK